jgi:outer membrane protein assembly factor BamA
MFFLLLATLGVVSCNPARKLASGEYLLVKNTLSVDKNKPSPDEFTGFIKQVPNHKTFGLYFNLRVYNMAKPGKRDSKFKRWLRNTIGEAPVILDTTLHDNSVKMMRQYLDNHGYFNSQVSREFEYKPKRKKVKVHYSIHAAEPYFIRAINYNIPDPEIYKIVSGGLSASKIKINVIYNTDDIDAERERLTRALLNEGYFYFSKEYISFEVDSALNSHKLDLTVTIANPVVRLADFPDSLAPGKHAQYLVNRVYVNTNYSVRSNETVPADTVCVIVPHRRKDRPPKVYYFIYQGKLKIRPKSVTQSVYIDAGWNYAVNDVERTFRQLSGIKMFRYVNILFNEVPDTTRKLIDCSILLTRAPLQAFSVDVVTTNTGGELGLSTGLIYENKNLLRGAEVFKIRVNGAVEIQKLNFSSETDPALKKLPFFNTIEYGIETGIAFNRFLIPIPQERFSKSFRPRTSINTGYNYQKRPDYTRYVVKGSFAYEWNESDYKSHIFTPFEVNMVKIFPDSAFSAKIEALQDRILKNSYKDHLITALKYSYIYNTQQLNKVADFIYFRTDAEIAGLLFWAYSNAKGEPGSYSINDIPYSQYARLYSDFRFYHMFDAKNTLVCRAAAGIGFPLNKFNTLPFEKSFYMGGANSMRGWRLKTLGPGAYKSVDSTFLQFDRTGDIGIEANVEYRFPIYKILNGAIFIDAGNIWLRKKSENFENAEFNLQKFLGQVALDGGLGARLNFGFFVVRLDGAVVLKDPAMPEKQRWIWENSNRFLVIGNLGIGYPF